MLALKAISLQIWSDFIAKRVVRSRDSAQPFPDQYIFQLIFKVQRHSLAKLKLSIAFHE
jgi:hypothetical protein